MPETAVNEDDRFVFGKEDVRADEAGGDVLRGREQEQEQEQEQGEGER